MIKSIIGVKPRAGEQHEKRLGSSHQHFEKRELAASSIWRKLSGAFRVVRLLGEHNAVSGNTVDDVKQPIANSNEGSPAAFGDAQAQKLLEYAQSSKRGEALLQHEVVAAALVTARAKVQDWYAPVRASIMLTALCPVVKDRLRNSHRVFHAARTCTRNH